MFTTPNTPALVPFTGGKWLLNDFPQVTEVVYCRDLVLKTTPSNIALYPAYVNIASPVHHFDKKHWDMSFPRACLFPPAA